MSHDFQSKYESSTSMYEKDVPEARLPMRTHRTRLPEHVPKQCSRLMLDRTPEALRLRKDVKGGEQSDDWRKEKIVLLERGLCPRL